MSCSQIFSVRFFLVQRLQQIIRFPHSKKKYHLYTHSFFPQLFAFLRGNIRFITSLLPADRFRTDLSKRNTYYYFTHLRVFPTSVNWWFSHFILSAVRWQQVSSSLQNSSQYSGWSQQCCSLDGLNSSSDFQLFQSLYRTLGDRCKRTKKNYYYCYNYLKEIGIQWKSVWEVKTWFQL